MKRIIYTKHAPAPIGPYSQAVQYGNTLYVSGQICINPATGELNNADVSAETHQVMKNLEAVLNAAGMRFQDVVKCGIFLQSMDDFAVVNEIYALAFPSDPPARETVAVKTLPKNVRVEISCIAVR